MSLGAFVKRVRAELAGAGVGAEVRLGWLQRAQQTNQGPGGANRIVISPSDPGGRGGRLGKEFGNLGNTEPRPLLSWDRSLYVSIWAADPEAPHDEEKQIDATEDLFVEFVRAMHRAGAAAVVWSDTQWTVPSDHSFGRELLVPVVLKQVVLDAAEGKALVNPVIGKNLLPNPSPP